MARPTTPQDHQHPSTREDRATLGVIASYLHDLTPHEHPRTLAFAGEEEQALEAPAACAA